MCSIKTCKPAIKKKLKKKKKKNAKLAELEFGSQD
jgi:hypothetical protein